MKNNEGFSLIELLVVVIVFAIIGVVASETIILTLRGTSKADATTKVRNNLDFAVGAMERQIRGAQKIDSSTTCNNTAQNSLAIVDQDDNKVTFSCVGENVNHLPSYVASASAALTPVALTSSNI